MTVKYEYEELKAKYMDFSQPRAQIVVGGKEFSDNKYKLVLSDVEVELTTGGEASSATFSIYRVFDEEKEAYDLSKIKNYALLGSSIEVSFGYGDYQTEIFVGFISSVRFVSDKNMPHHIEVSAMDVKGMMMSGASVKQLKAKNYGDAVKEIFAEELYQRMQAEGIFRKIKISATPDNGKEEIQKNRVIEMMAESDYEFVQKAAKHFNYEFFVSCGTVIFRKAKEAEESCLMEFGFGKKSAVLHYDLNYDMTGLVKTVEVRGIDTAKGNVVDASVSVSNKISSGNKAKGLIGKTKKVILDAGAFSKDIAKERAESAMEQLTYRYGQLTCECIGIPEIQAGHFIRVKSLQNGEKKVGSDFYITNVRHVLNDYDGYKTFITAIAASLF